MHVRHLQSHTTSPPPRRPPAVLNSMRITDDASQFALRSTRNRPRRAVRRGASWTAAYHRQLTVAAVARPLRSSVAALGVLAVERSWWLLAQTTFARSSLQPVSRGRAFVAVVDPASRHATASVAGVSSRRCPPIRSWRPGSGCPAVRCPVTWDGRPEGPAVGRLLSTRLASSRPLSSRPVSALVGPDASVSSHSGGGGGDQGRGGRATVTTGTGGGPGGCRAVDGSIDGRGGRDAGDAAESRWSLGGRWRTRAAGLGCGPRRPRLPAERPGRPGRRAERPWRAAA